MKKYFYNTVVLLFVLSVGLLSPKRAHAGWVLDILGAGADDIIASIALIVGSVVLTLASLLTMLSGVALNYTLWYTIVQMSDNYSGIPTISNTWALVRDIANMGFIFVLLYASIQTILGTGKNIQILIKNIVIAAILVNFSLFFTKIVIDASNVIAVTFYGAIAPGAVVPGAIPNFSQSGLSNAFVDLLNLSTLWNAGELNSATILTVGILGTVVLLIATFSFFTITILLIIRYAILIFVLILSPIAIVASVLPGLDKYSSQWKDALIGQAFFAPIYLFLTWIVVKLLQGMPSFGEKNWAESLNGTITGPAGTVSYTSGAIELIVQFALVIIMMLMALIVAKNWANKAPGIVGTATKWITGAANNAAFGGVSWAGRNTIGRIAEARANNQNLQERASLDGMSGRIARLQLATSKKIAGGSMDIRGVSSINKYLDAGKATGSGGFAKYKDDKAKEMEKKAKEFAPSPEVIAQRERDLERHNDGDEEATEKIENERIKERERYVKKLNRLRRQKDKKTAKGASHSELKKLDNMIIEANRGLDTTIDTTTYANARVENLKGIKGKLDSAADRRKKQFANTVENSFWAKVKGYNVAAAAKLRAGNKKTAKELVDELLVATGEKPTTVEKPADEPKDTPKA